MIKIAIDPGWSGGVAAMFQDKTVTVDKCPSTQSEMVDILNEIKSIANTDNENVFAILEKVHSMPGNGVASTWKFAANYATWQTALIVLSIPFVEITPQKWMKLVGGTPKDKKARKNYLKDYAKKLYPDIKITLDTSDAAAMLSIFDRVFPESLIGR